MILPFVFSLSFAGVYLSRTNTMIYEQIYTVEDGFIEWLTFLGLFLCSVLCFYRAAILKPIRSMHFSISLVFWGLLFLFGFAEEISWGQRLLGFESPAFFQQYNSQGEFNLHNLKFGATKINKLVFGLILGIAVCLYFLVFPTLYKNITKVQTIADSYAIAIPKNIHVLSYIFLALTVFFISSSKRGEILEFGGCWIWLMMLIEPYNHKIFSR